MSGEDEITWPDIEATVRYEVDDGLLDDYGNVQVTVYFHALLIAGINLLDHVPPGNIREQLLKSIREWILEERERELRNGG